MDTDPGKVRANAYDMVINGVEVGGGSIRIHDSALQSKMFDCLGFTHEAAQAQFGFLMGAFKFGAPPHGGIAFGFDRLASMFAGLDSIRDVIAFPKVKDASCLMSEAPAPVDAKQLEELQMADSLQQHLHLVRQVYRWELVFWQVQSVLYMIIISRQYLKQRIMTR